MIKEIYCKLPSDPNYRPKLETSDESEMILQQIKMVLGTKPGQVMGAPAFGIDLQDYLFSYNNSPEDIKFLINAAIGYYIKFDSTRYEVGCEINFGKNANDPYEYAVIDIFINKKKCLGVLVAQD